MFQILKNKNCKFLRTYARDENLRKSINKMVKFNHVGKVTEAVETYEEIKENDLTVDEYNSMIASFAPKKLMFKWFSPYKCYVDMYDQAGNFKAKERLEEAKQIFQDLKNKNMPLDINTFNSFIKVQMTCGKQEVLNSFSTFNDAVSKLDANIGSYGLLLRACSLVQNIDVAEEIYTYTNLKKKRDGVDSEHIGISFYNTMLDCYAEAASPVAFSFFHEMLKNGLPVDGGTFNAYAKACIFQDERIRLVEMVELMRVHGVLQLELSKPVRQEIYAAQKRYSKYNDARKPVNIANEMEKKGIDVFEDFRGIGTFGEIPWGRRVDLHSPEVMQYLQPYLQKYTVDIEKFSDIDISSKLPPHPNDAKIPKSAEFMNDPYDPLLDSLKAN
eukprot:gene12065-5559_t